MKSTAQKIMVAGCVLVSLSQLLRVSFTSNTFDGMRGKHLIRTTSGFNKWTEPCNFHEKGTGPIPVVLMSLGRSGSSVTWDTLSALTGKRNIAFEATGGNPRSSQVFFEDLVENELAFYNWTVQLLCHIQTRRPDVTEKAGIAGFQWKPFMSSFNHEYAIEGLNAIGASTDPEIKVVYLRRNALDRKISNLRHEKSTHTSHSITAHCAVGDDECIKKQLAFETNFVFPVGAKLIQWLEGSERRNRMVLKRLETSKAKFVQVSYEKLFNGDDAEEWVRILAFLNVGPSSGLTMVDVRAAFSMAATHKHCRNETISNFHEVEQTLIGTEFEHYLYD